MVQELAVIHDHNPGES